MTNLRSSIQTLASQFAVNLIGAMRSASLDELLAVSDKRRALAKLTAGPRARRATGGRLGRRSDEEIAAVIDSIVSLVGKHRDGLRAEQIRKLLSCEAKELPRPLAEAVAGGRLTKTGQKRATTYFVGSGGAGRRRRGTKKKKA